MILPWFSLRKLNENYLQYNFNENLCIFIDMDKKIKGIILAKSSKDFQYLSQIYSWNTIHLLEINTLNKIFPMVNYTSFIDFTIK